MDVVRFFTSKRYGRERIFFCVVIPLTIAIVMGVMSVIKWKDAQRRDALRSSLKSSQHSATN